MKVDKYKEVEDNIEYDIIENPFTKSWYLNGKLHRLNGPAIEDMISDPEAGEDICNFWYYNGEEIPCKTQEEFEHWIKLKYFW